MTGTPVPTRIVGDLYVCRHFFSIPIYASSEATLQINWPDHHWQPPTNRIYKDDLVVFLGRENEAKNPYTGMKVYAFLVMLTSGQMGWVNNTLFIQNFVLLKESAKSLTTKV